jgi:hypothetical protein
MIDNVCDVRMSTCTPTSSRNVIFPQCQCETTIAFADCAEVRFIVRATWVCHECSLCLGMTRSFRTGSASA